MTAESPVESPLPSVAKIALFTVRSFAIEHAIPVIQAHPNAELVCVLTTPGPKNRRSRAYCEVVDALERCGHANVDLIVSNKKSKWGDLIACYGANLILCSGFPWIIPESLINDPRLPLGVINFHNSLLPKYMGPNAFGWGIVNNDGEVGYTAHRMSPEIDTGPILIAERVPLEVNEDYQDLKKKVPPVFTGMVQRVIGMALAGDPGTPQAGTPSQAPKFDPAFRWIDFNDTALQNHNKVRAFYGERDHPKGALAKIDGTTLCFTKTRLHPVKLIDLPELVGEHKEQLPEELTSLTSALSTSSGLSSSVETDSLPGAVLTPQGESFFIQCGDTSLEVLEWNVVE
jgi:methionyl-tRNA formyltransferase